MLRLASCIPSLYPQFSLCISAHSPSSLVAVSSSTGSPAAPEGEAYRTQEDIGKSKEKHLVDSGTRSLLPAPSCQSSSLGLLVTVDPLGPLHPTKWRKSTRNSIMQEVWIKDECIHIMQMCTRSQYVIRPYNNPIWILMQGGFVGAFSVNWSLKSMWLSKSMVRLVWMKIAYN